MIHIHPPTQDAARPFISDALKSAAVITSLYRCGRNTWTAPESEPRRVNTNERPYFVEMRLALVMRYFVWGSKEETLTEAYSVASS